MPTDEGLVPDGLLSALSRYTEQLSRFIPGPTAYLANLYSMQGRVREVSQQYGTFWSSSDGVMEMLREMRSRAASMKLLEEEALASDIEFTLRQARQLAENIDWVPASRDDESDTFEGFLERGLVDDIDDVDEWTGTKEALEKVEYGED